MLSCEGIGKNIEQAIENALFELKASREDVDIKIISQGGFLKKARVVVTISPDAVEKYEKKNALKAELLKEEKQEEVKEEVSEPVKEEVKEEKKEEKKEEEKKLEWSQKRRHLKKRIFTYDIIHTRKEGNINLWPQKGKNLLDLLMKKEPK